MPIFTIETDRVARAMCLAHPLARGVLVGPRIYVVALADFKGLPRPDLRLPVRGQVRAIINRGRWMVACPGCHSSFLTSWADPWFYCVACHMVKNEGKPMAVVFPAEQLNLERVLLMRPIANQNWEWESIAQAARENLAFGAVRRIG